MSSSASEWLNEEGEPAPMISVQRVARFLEIVDVIAAANRPLLPSMTERYFRRMVLRMAEHQLLYEDYRDGMA